MSTASLVPVFTRTILPVLAVAAVGYVLGRVKPVDVGPLNTVTLYVLVPALIFHSLVTSPVDGATTARLALAVVAFTGSMFLVGEAVARAVGERGATRAALVMAGMFPNVGNFGIPVSTFAFGAVGRSAAILYTAVQNLLLYTLGIYVVSRAGGDPSVRYAVGRALRLPVLYAVVAAGAAVALGVVPPADGTFMRTVEMVGDASIPLFLLVLGVQFANTDADLGGTLTRVAPAVGLKLLVAPAVGLLVVGLVGLGAGAVADTFVVETAAPVAIIPLVLLLEFGEERGEGLSGPDYLSTAILVTMLGSVPVVTVLLVLLKGGVP
ncbi:MAG: AEC family transporter [Halobacteriaceae archaeon]